MYQKVMFVTFRTQAVLDGTVNLDRDLIISSTEVALHATGTEDPAVKLGTMILFTQLFHIHQVAADRIRRRDAQILRGRLRLHTAFARSKDGELRAR